MKFIDTNILVYFVDRRDSVKQQISRTIISDAFHNGGYAISSQVLNEFSNIALKKLELSEDEVAAFVRIFRRFAFIYPEIDWTERALKVRERYKLQFYDSLLLVAAESGGCDVLLSEDLSDGQVYGVVKVVNPYVR